MIRCENCGLKVPVDVPSHIPEKQHPAYIKKIAKKEFKLCTEEYRYTERQKKKWKSAI